MTNNSVERSTPNSSPSDGWRIPTTSLSLLRPGDKFVRWEPLAHPLSPPPTLRVWDRRSNQRKPGAPARLDWMMMRSNGGRLVACLIRLESIAYRAFFGGGGSVDSGGSLCASLAASTFPTRWRGNEEYNKRVDTQQSRARWWSVTKRDLQDKARGINSLFRPRTAADEESL